MTDDIQAVNMFSLVMEASNETEESKNSPKSNPFAKRSTAKKGAVSKQNYVSETQKKNQKPITQLNRSSILMANSKPLFPDTSTSMIKQSDNSETQHNFLNTLISDTDNATNQVHKNISISSSNGELIHSGLPSSRRGQKKRGGQKGLQKPKKLNESMSQTPKP